MNLRWAAALALAGALGAGCATRTAAPAAIPVVQGPVVHDLRSLADLATVFDQDRGHPRIVLLLSPT
jgi:hypothetical protein